MTRHALTAPAALAVLGLVALRLVSAGAPRAVGRLESALTVMSPGKTPALVRVTYTGIAGDCLGKAYSHGEHDVPAGGAVRLAPGPRGDKVLPEACLAAARVDAVRGDTVVLVTAGDGGATNPAGRGAAYAARSIGGRTGARVGLPRLLRESGRLRLASLLAVTNGGTDKADIRLELFDPDGKALAPCPECDTTLEAGATALWDSRSLAALAKASVASAVLSANAPVAAAVAELDADERADLAAYAPAPPGAEPEEAHLALALKEPGRGQSGLALANLDLRLPATAITTFLSQSGGQIALTWPPVQSGAAHHMALADEAKLPDGAYAVTAQADRAVALLGVTEWPKSGGRALEWSAEPATDLVAPLVYKSAAGQSAEVHLFNPDAQLRASVDLELVALGRSAPALALQVLLPPARSVTLDLATDPRFANLPAGFAGSLRARSSLPLALSVALRSDGGAVSAYPGQDAATSAVTQLAPLVWSAWAPDQPAPTATDTATPRDTATSTPIATITATATPRLSVTPTATATAPRVTDTATATRPVPTTNTPRPTATATRPGLVTRTPTPLPTRPASKRRWQRLTSTNSRLPGNDLHYVEAAGDAVWLRVRRPDDQPDQVVRVKPSPMLVYPSQRSAVDQNFELVRRQGTVRDLWALDDAQRVWVGPSYSASPRVWTDLAVDEAQPAGGALRFETRALVDPEGQAAVPFAAETDCMGAPEPCAGQGLRGFAPTGQVAYDLRVLRSTDAGSFGLETLHLLPGGRGGAFAAAARPAQAGQAYAVSQMALYVLPNLTPVDYPHLSVLAPDGSTLRNAGYASAATLRPDGRLAAFTWVEAHAPPPSRDLSWHVYENVWTGAAWEVTDLTTSPLFLGDARNDRVTAATYCPDGALWLATYGGAVASRHENTWEVTAPPGNPDFAGVVDAACGSDGTVWMATENGLLQGVVGVPFPIYAPFTRK